MEAMPSKNANNSKRVQAVKPRQNLDAKSGREPLIPSSFRFCAWMAITLFFMTKEDSAFHLALIIGLYLDYTGKTSDKKIIGPLLRRVLRP